MIKNAPSFQKGDFSKRSDDSFITLFVKIDRLRLIELLNYGIQICLQINHVNSAFTSLLKLLGSSKE